MAKGKDVERASVRVDLETDSTSGLDVPAIESNRADRSPVSAGAVALGVVALAVIGLTLFFLRPDENAAADGTVREAPTTTVPDEESSAIEEEAPDLVLLDESLLLPTVIDTPLLPDSIVAVDDGFLGLVSGVDLAPTILQSTNGSDWQVVETTADTIGFPRDWQELTVQQGQLQILASTIGDVREVRRDVFVSEAGSDWRQVVLLGSLGGQPLPELPVVVRDEDYLATGFSNSEILHPFLVEHTSLAIEENGACFMATQPSTTPGNGTEFAVRDCVSSPANLVLNEDTVRSSFPAEQVLACARALTSGDLRNALIHQELDFELERTILDFYVGGSQPVRLSSGGLAVIDIGSQGSRDLETCEGLAQISFPTDEAVIVVDGETNEVRRWPFPGRTPGSSETTELGEVAVLGEVPNTNSETSIAVAFQSGVWLLNRSTGEWSRNFRRFEPDPQSIGLGPLGDLETQVRLSESGRFLYSITEGRLFVLRTDLDETSGFTSFEVGISGEPFEANEILFANDEILFVRSAEQVVRLENPLG